MVWCFSYINEMTLSQNYMELYKLWRERKPMARISLEAKVLLKPNKCIFKLRN